MKNKKGVLKGEDESFDFLQKVIIIGDSGVGKSNILLRYSWGNFAQNHMATIGLNYVFKIVTIGDVRVKLQIWDTAGQDKFKTITKSYYRNSQGVLVVFAIDSRDSYYSVERWMEDLSETTGEKTRVLLVGNKKDLASHREVSVEEATDLAKSYGVQYVECSAKTNQNIQEMFDYLSKEMKVQFIDNTDPPIEDDQQHGLNVQSSSWQRRCCQR